jgi:NAD(P)-binding Rossmann-like domain
MPPVKPDAVHEKPYLVRELYAKKVLQDYEDLYQRELHPVLHLILPDVDDDRDTAATTPEKEVDIYGTIAQWLGGQPDGKTLPPPNKAVLQIPNPSFKIGILGAGAAGLYTALMIDYLNEDEPSGVTYEILEGDDRPGGRLYTHVFEGYTPNDYYVGHLISW